MATAVVAKLRFLVGMPLACCLMAAPALAQTDKKVTSIKSLDEFDRCVAQQYDGDACLVALDKYVQTHPQEAMKAGKRVRLSFNAPVSLRYFEAAAKQKPEGFCQDQDVQLAVVGGLALPERYPDAARARALFAGECHESLAKVVVATLAEDRAGYFPDNVCPILAKKNTSVAACRPAAAVEQAATVDDRLPKIDKAQIKLGIVKAYRGGEGERVTMAPIQGGDGYLIRFEGIAGPWNGKVLLHKWVDKGNGGADFWTEHNGARWVSVVRRDGTMTLFAPGMKSQEGVYLSYAEKPSQETDPATLVNAYQP